MTTNETPRRTIRVSDQLWNRTLDYAHERNITASALIRAALREYMNEAPDERT